MVEEEGRGGTSSVCRGKGGGKGRRGFPSHDIFSGNGKGREKYGKVEGGEINDGGMRGEAGRRIPFLLGVWAGVEGGNQTAEGEREKGGNSLPFDGGEKRKRSRAFFVFRLLPPTLLRAQSRCPPLPVRLEHWFAHHAGIKGGGRRYEEAGGLFPRAFNLLEDFVVSSHLVLSSLARAGGTIPPQPTAEVKVAGWGARGNVPPARFLLFPHSPFHSPVAGSEGP